MGVWVQRFMYRYVNAMQKQTIQPQRKMWKGNKYGAWEHVMDTHNGIGNGKSDRGVRDALIRIALSLAQGCATKYVNVDHNAPNEV